MKLALVAPSDRICGAIAERMASRATVEILTTCRGREDVPRDAFDPGLSRVGRVTRRRFRCDHPGVPALSSRLAAVVRSGTAALPLEERWMQECGPYSSALLDHLSARQGDFDAFLFFSLESATTVFGLPRLRRAAVLAPRVQDWSVVRSGLLRSTLQRAAGFVFDSAEERRRMAEICAVSRPSAVSADSSGDAYFEVLARACEAAG